MARLKDKTKPLEPKVQSQCITGRVLSIEKMHWRIYVLADVIQGGKTYTRQFGTALTPPTPSKRSTAFEAALDVVDKVIDAHLQEKPGDQI